MKIILLIFLFITTQLFGLVSIKPVEIGEKVGVSGALEIGLDTKRGNTHKDGYKAAIKVMYDTNSSYLLWLHTMGEYAKVNEVENTNKQYAHLRYIHTLSEKNIRYEGFLQTQEDKFKAINHRRLAGLGLRFKLFDSSINAKGYYALGAFYEDIHYIDPSIDPNEHQIRVNTYLAYSIDLANKSSFVYTVYYQPSVDNFSDYVITNRLELNLQIYQELYLKFSASYDKDSKPPNGIDETYDFTQSTTFVYGF